MHNSVYAFDADAMSPVSMLWQVNLGTAVPALLLYGPDGDIALEIGILSTGLIDLQRGVLYVVADTLEGGAPVATTRPRRPCSSARPHPKRYRRWR